MVIYITYTSIKKCGKTELRKKEKLQTNIFHVLRRYKTHKGVLANQIQQGIKELYMEKIWK